MVADRSPFSCLVTAVTDEIVPHFHNEPGVPVIVIGAKKFMCIGALPPQDHPHVFCDMGEDVEYVCPYCSTLYRNNPALAPNQAYPSESNCTTLLIANNREQRFSAPSSNRVDQRRIIRIGLRAIDPLRYRPALQEIVRGGLQHFRLSLHTRKLILTVF